MQGAAGQGAVPRTHESLLEMNVADWAKKPVGADPPNDAPAADVDVGEGTVGADEAGEGIEAFGGVLEW